MLEKMRKDEEEEKEAQTDKYSLVTQISAMDKGKGPMEDVQQASISQQVKSLIHTSQHFKQNMKKMLVC